MTKQLFSEVEEYERAFSDFTHSNALDVNGEEIHDIVIDRSWGNFANFYITKDMGLIPAETLFKEYTAFLKSYE